MAQIPRFNREKITEASTLNNRLEDLLARAELNNTGKTSSEIRVDKTAGM